MDRRAAFFLGTAVLCAAMVLPTPDDLRWVPVALAIVYVVLSLGAALDTRSRHQHRDERQRKLSA